MCSVLVVTSLALAVGVTDAVAASEPPKKNQNVAATITGSVVDETGEPLIGVTVMEVGNSANGQMTDVDGNFSIRVKPGAKLKFSYVGYKPIELPASDGMKVDMGMDTSVLDEVVVVGFGVQKKVNLTGSVGMASSKDIAGRPVQSAAAALQGVVPGLNIMSSGAGGELNASKSINVRGTATIGEGSSGSPLILIDGMEGDINTLNPADIENISVLKDAAASSIYGSRAPFGVILITTKTGSTGKTSVNYSNSFRWNQPLNPMKTMDSWEYINYLNDVESYTSPGSKYFEDDFVEGAWQYYTGQSDNYIYEINWADYGPTENNYGQQYRRWGRSGENSGTFANVNWLDELYKKTAFAQEHNLTVNGGNEKVNYYVSGNFLDQNGFMKYGNDTYDRFSLMGKVQAKAFPWLTMQLTTRWNRTDYSRPSWLDDGFYEKVLRRLPPTNPKYDPQGYIAGDYNYILHLQDGGRHKEQNDIFTNQLKFIFTPLKDWNIVAELNGRVNSDWTHQTFFPVYAHDAYDPENNWSSETTHLAFDSRERSSVSEYAYRSTYLNLNVFTDYDFRWLDKNNTKVILGFQMEDFKDRQVTGYDTDLLVNEVDVLDQTTNRDDISAKGNYQRWRTVGFFGRINYNYDSKYLLEVNLRYDGTSRFRRKSRWVWSPSFSAGWNIDKENFWEGARNWVQSLKLRVSYGQLANQNTSSWYPTYRIIDVVNQGSSWLVNGTKPNTAGFPALISPLLTWEKVRTVNLGLDFGAFDFRLTGSFDYFWRTNKDMVGPSVTYPAILGASVPPENNLSMRTRGWELQIGWQDNVRDFSYSAKLNLSDDRTKILDYPNREKYLDKRLPGEYIGNIYGLTTIGVAHTQEEMDAHLANVNQDAIGSDWQAGDIMYADLDNDNQITKGKTLDDLGDLKLIGNDQPRYRIGLNLYGAWKGIDLTLFFQGVLKRDYYFNPNSGTQTSGKSAVFWGATSGGYNESIFLKEHLDYWRDESSALGENRDAYYARPLWWTNKNREIQTRYLQNAAYLRLKNLQVGYSFPKAWMEKIHLQSIRVYFSAENLFTITKLSKVLDPESLETTRMKSGGSYPIAKTYSFGLQVTL